MYIAIFKDFKPKIIALPFLTNKLSSRLVDVLSPLSYPDAHTLMGNLKTHTVCQDNCISDIVPHQCLTFKQALRSVGS